MNFNPPFLLLLLFFGSISFAASSFTVAQIEVDGLARVSEQTVLNYLPIKVGEQFTDAKADQIINALYGTQFFSYVSISRQAQTLIIKVDERPIISSINIIGNKELPKDKLNEALKRMNFVQGEVFDQTILEQVKQALSEQYYGMGRYSAKITETIKSEPRHRVSITLNVSEGMSARVMKISILGNSAFSDSTLLKQLALAPTGFFSLFNSKDQYSKDKLDKSIEALQSYYLNQGYVDMHIDSTQVTITPDKKFVYVVLRIKEGEIYHFSGFDLMGELILPEETLESLVPIKVGDIFSRQTVLDSNKILTTKLGDSGYAFAKVTVKPRVNPEKHTVFLSFDIDPGNTYYVRRIHFTGNTATSNMALRNWFTQFEGSLYSASKIEQSTRNLRQLPYLKAEEMDVTRSAVPGSDDQVDLLVKVKEQSSAQFQFSVGYSQAFGALITTGITQNNFMGTGKTVGFNFTRNGFQTGYSVSYFDPFFTYNGISRSMQAFYQKTQPGAVVGGNNAGYSVTAMGLSDIFGFPLTNYQQFNLGYNLQYTDLKIGGKPSQEVAAFTQQYGSTFYQAILTAGWSYNTLDRFQLPTEGMRQSLSLNVAVPSTKNNLEYYTVNYQNRLYQPISSGFILSTNAVAGYGDGYGRFSGLPFLQNYYAGGIGTMGQNRAYLPNSLGPLDSNKQPLGGNLLLSGTVGLIVPTFLDKYNVRTSFFVDAGNVFNTKTSAWQPPNMVSLNNVRYSYGFQVEWWTPLGMPLVFSLAQPINAKPGDRTLVFQFNLGGTS